MLVLYSVVCLAFDLNALVGVFLVLLMYAVLVLIGYIAITVDEHCKEKKRKYKWKYGKNWRKVLRQERIEKREAEKQQYGKYWRLILWKKRREQRKAERQARIEKRKAERQSRIEKREAEKQNELKRIEAEQQFSDLIQRVQKEYYFPEKDDPSILEYATPYLNMGAEGASFDGCCVGEYKGVPIRVINDFYFRNLRFRSNQQCCNYGTGIEICNHIEGIMETEDNLIVFPKDSEIIHPFIHPNGTVRVKGKRHQILSGDPVFDKEYICLTMDDDRAGRYLTESNRNKIISYRKLHMDETVWFGFFGESILLFFPMLRERDNPAYLYWDAYKYKDKTDFKVALMANGIRNAEQAVDVFEIRPGTADSDMEDADNIEEELELLAKAGKITFR